MSPIAMNLFIMLDSIGERILVLSLSDGGTNRTIQGILTYRRYTLREFKLKFSPLSKAYDGKYTKTSKK